MFLSIFSRQIDTPHLSPIDRRSCTSGVFLGYDLEWSETEDKGKVEDIASDLDMTTLTREPLLIFEIFKPGMGLTLFYI